MQVETNHQNIIDKEHLRLIQIAFYIIATFSFLSFMRTLISYAFYGIHPGYATTDFAIASGVKPHWLVYCFTYMVFAYLLAMTFLLFVAARFIKSQKHLNMCLIVALLSSLIYPLGSVLGIWASVALSRHSIKQYFQTHS